MRQDISVVQALDELRQVYKVITKNGTGKLIATPKPQKKLLKLL
jgi:hypothetical protein